MLLILEDVVHNLVIEGAVRETLPARGCLMGKIGRSRVFKNSPAAVDDLRLVCETNMPGEPSIPTGTIVLDLERVDENLGICPGD